MKNIAQFWDDAIVPSLVDYVAIPAKSPHFDRDWEKHGHIESAVKLAADWCAKHAVKGMKQEVVRLPGRTPVLFIEIEGSGPTVLMYGHLDKQPEMVGWREGYGPWDPLIAEGKLYGRGGADDGYAVFASLAALRALQNVRSAFTGEAASLPRRRSSRASGIGLLFSSCNTPRAKPKAAPVFGSAAITTTVDSAARRSC